MVYCTKCGTENPDDALLCSNCGASMKSPAYQKSKKGWDMEDECFGGRSRTTWPLLIGVFIILIGLSSLLENTYSWARFDNIWPLFLIALGLMIIYNRIQQQ